jgi:hypothetical protein
LHFVGCGLLLILKQNTFHLLLRDVAQLEHHVSRCGAKMRFGLSIPATATLMFDMKKKLSEPPEPELRRFFFAVSRNHIKMTRLRKTAKRFKLQVQARR